MARKAGNSGKSRPKADKGPALAPLFVQWEKRGPPPATVNVWTAEDEARLQAHNAHVTALAATYSAPKVEGMGFDRIDGRLNWRGFEWNDK